MLDKIYRFIRIMERKSFNLFYADYIHYNKRHLEQERLAIFVHVKALHFEKNYIPRYMYLTLFLLF